MAPVQAAGRRWCWLGVLHLTFLVAAGGSLRRLIGCPRCPCRWPFFDGGVCWVALGAIVCVRPLGCVGGEVALAAGVFGGRVLALRRAADV